MIIYQPVPLCRFIYCHQGESFFTNVHQINCLPLQIQIFFFQKTLSKSCSLNVDWNSSLHCRLIGLSCKICSASSCDDSIGLADILNRPVSRVQFLKEGKDSVFSLCHSVQTGSVAYPASFIQWLPGSLSPRVKWLGHEADHSPPSSAGVKNA
jgi:hypothetical protein